MTRLCRYCAQPFSIGPQALRRTYCYAKDCASAREEERRAYKAAFDARHRPATAPDTGAPPPAPTSANDRDGRRNCLCCSATFRSRGPEHRICRACKHSEGWRSALASHTALYW